jgi:hypothetical protein
MPHARSSRGCPPRGLACVFGLALFAAETAGVAAPVPTTRLAYVVDGDTAGCPDEGVLRALVATHLGYDPFRDDGSWLVKAHVQTAGSGLAGRLEVEDETGASFGGRELHAPRGACRDLVESMALATSLAIDPVTAPRIARPLSVPLAPPSPPALVIEVGPPVTPPPSPPPSSSPLVPFAVVAAHGSLGGTPGPALGFTVGGGAETRNVSLGLEGRVDLPTDASTAGVGGVEATRLSFLAVLCLHTHSRLALYGCAIADAGPMWSRGTGVTQETSLVTAHASIGLRLRAAWNVSSFVAVGVRAELLAALTRSELSVDNAGKQVVVWASAPCIVTLGPDLTVRFP